MSCEASGKGRGSPGGEWRVGRGVGAPRSGGGGGEENSVRVGADDGAPGGGDRTGGAPPLGEWATGRGGNGGEWGSWGMWGDRVRVSEGVGGLRRPGWAWWVGQCGGQLGRSAQRGGVGGGLFFFTFKFLTFRFTIFSLSFAFSFSTI